jgi:2'-5' RNA ligase
LGGKLAGPHPLIVTALLDRLAFARLDALRRAHYPAERNLVPAHITLFHHLPGMQAAAIDRRLAATAQAERPIDARVAGLRNLGRGVALRIDSPELETLRAELAEVWADWLIPQDRQRFAPHVTIQNKVDAAAARTLHDRLRNDFAPWRLRIDGLTLWAYRDGRWDHLKDYRFG